LLSPTARGAKLETVLDELRETPEVLYGAALALLVVVLLTPAVGGMARLLGVVDRPDRRRLNRNPIPRLGGIALFLGVLVPALAFLPIGREIRGLLLGAAVATTVGAVDDFRGLLWWQKLGGQVVAAAIPTAFGIWIDRFTFPFVGIHELPAWVGIPATVVWIVALMNMVNFLDGLDGLAAGVCSIAGATFAVIALSLGKPEAAIVSAIVAGATLGFLRHNFYPARIFMGDSGALLLGFVLATVAIQGLLKTAATVALFFPLFVLAVPILDTSFVIARRLKHGQKVTAPDQAHLHFRFLRRGYSQRRAALTMYAWCVTLAAAALATRFIPFREGGEWHVGPTLLAGAIGLVALAFSAYVVYLLEIVKLANPYLRRREQEARLDRKTA
jgi:UDP-GlcNAc:undecaprenyl-phosphate/decaprenyl-phosphate GlcNAc-1-phosphate transferase